MTMFTRLCARIAKSQSQPRVRHYRGLPPELSDGDDNREEMSAPSVVVIEERRDGVFLFRFRASGECVGDTWHRSIDEAREQAEFEFGELLSAWRVVPTEVGDVVKFGLQLAD
jgi:hypothetical protein